MLYNYVGEFDFCKEHIKTGKCACCEFKEDLGNWIGCMPGEFGDIVDCGAVNQFKVVGGLPQGGVGVKCKAGGVNCKYKPLDCRIYPFFPKKIDLENNKVYLIFGTKCPQEKEGMKDIAKQVSNYILKICREDPNLVDWFEASAKGFKGYEDYE